MAAGHQGDLGARLLNRKTEIASYALSFAVIAYHWVRHHGLFRALDRIDTTVTALNLADLAFIAFLPYPTRVLGLYGSETAAVILYAATCALIAIDVALMRLHAQRANLFSEVGTREMARREHWAIVPAIFLASIPIAFVSPRLAELSWVLLFVVRRFR